MRRKLYAVYIRSNHILRVAGFLKGNDYSTLALSSSCDFSPNETWIFCGSVVHIRTTAGCTFHSSRVNHQPHQIGNPNTINIAILTNREITQSASKPVTIDFLFIQDGKYNRPRHGNSAPSNEPDE
jgi:hypothetical protein